MLTRLLYKQFAIIHFVSSQQVAKMLFRYRFSCAPAGPIAKNVH